MIAMFSDAVVRVGVDDELGFATQVFHRLVHLLGVDDRLVPVLLAANEERRRGDVLHPVEG